MGYTHYVSRRKRLPLATFRLAVEDCRKVVEALCREKGIVVQLESDDTETPLFGDVRIQFNGVGENGHETFVIDRNYTPFPSQPKPSRGEGWFEFTKTARKPYDAAVCACLIVFNHHFGKAYTVSSDGEDGDEGWATARAFCQRVLGYGADFTLKVPPKMTVHGLAYSGGWFNGYREGVARSFSNGWELRKRTNAEFKYTVEEANAGENASIVAGGETIRIARWRATVVYFQREFQDAPYLDEFVNAMLEMPCEWSSFLAGSDKLEDHGHEELARKVRERIPGRK